MDWVCKYLEYLHGIAGGARVIDEIDRRSVFHIDHHSPLSHCYNTGSRLRPLTLDSEGSNKAEILASGLATIPRL